MAKSDVKDVAFILFCEDMPMKEISTKLDVSVQTLTRWSKDGGWKEQKKYIENAAPRRLAELHAELGELQKAIKNRDPGWRFATKEECAIRTQTIKNIKDLSRKYSISQIIIMGRDLVNFTNTIDNDQAKKITSLLDMFINEQIKKQKWEE